MTYSVWIGYDPREAEAFAVARHSIRRLSGNVPVYPLVLEDLREAGLYKRPTSKRDGKLYDAISEHPMATEFAISRFLVPRLARGWAVFMDCDVLARADIAQLFAEADDKYAVMCVKHDHKPKDGVKMDGQAQTRYQRKNWSSVMLFNCDHPSNKKLTVDMINTVPGRDLHALRWLKDDEIGALDGAWNFLVGHSDPSIDPSIVHFTEGGPWFDGYGDVAYADEWRAERSLWLMQDAWVKGRPSTWPGYANGEDKLEQVNP